MLQLITYSFFFNQKMLKPPFFWHANLNEHESHLHGFQWYSSTGWNIPEFIPNYTLICCLSTSHMSTCPPSFFPSFFLSLFSGLFGSDVLYSRGDCWITSQQTGETSGVSKSWILIPLTLNVRGTEIGAPEGVWVLQRAGGWGGGRKGRHSGDLARHERKRHWSDKRRQGREGETTHPTDVFHR